MSDPSFGYELIVFLYSEPLKAVAGFEFFFECAGLQMTITSDL